MADLPGSRATLACQPRLTCAPAASCRGRPGLCLQAGARGGGGALPGGLAAVRPAGGACRGAGPGAGAGPQGRHLQRRPRRLQRLPALASARRRRASLRRGDQAQGRGSHRAADSSDEGGRPSPGWPAAAGLAGCARPDPWVRCGGAGSCAERLQARMAPWLMPACTTARLLSPRAMQPRIKSMLTPTCSCDLGPQ